MKRSLVLPNRFDGETIKACCAAVYESDWARLLLGDSFHPGGLPLTRQLGQLLQLDRDQYVLDVAAGQGASALFLARHFGCRMVGLEYGRPSPLATQEAAVHGRLVQQTLFVQGDAEALPFASHLFDAILCECAFCTFPDKRQAAAEWVRVLRPGGRMGLSDLTRSGSLPIELESLLGWVACLADARPVDEYVAYLETAGLAVEHVEPHDEALTAIVRKVQSRLLGAELWFKLKQPDFPGLDFGRVRQITREVAGAVNAGRLGYAVIIGRKRE